MAIYAYMHLDYALQRPYVTEVWSLSYTIMYYHACNSILKSTDPVAYQEQTTPLEIEQDGGIAENESLWEDKKELVSLVANTIRHWSSCSEDSTTPLTRTGQAAALRPGHPDAFLTPGPMGSILSPPVQVSDKSLALRNPYEGPFSLSWSTAHYSFVEPGPCSKPPSKSTERRLLLHPPHPCLHGLACCVICSHSHMILLLITLFGGGLTLIQNHFSTSLHKKACWCTAWMIFHPVLIMSRTNEWYPVWTKEKKKKNV